MAVIPSNPLDPIKWHELAQDERGRYRARYLGEVSPEAEAEGLKREIYETDPVRFRWAVHNNVIKAQLWEPPA